MKFTCEKNQLFPAITMAARTVATKSPMAVLEGIYVNAGEMLTLTGYNMEIGIRVSTEADVQVQGAYIFPARLFLDIVRKLPDETIAIEVDANKRASIRSGPSVFTIMVLDCENYPALPEITQSMQEQKLELTQSTLKDMIGGTIFCVADNITRFIHTGCQFDIEGDVLSLVAVDGYRLAQRRYRFEQEPGSNFQFVVPAAALKEIEKMLVDADGVVQILIGNRHIQFQIDNATLICRLLEGDFLDWRRVVPKDNPVQLAASVSTLLTTVERVGLIVSDSISSPVRCRFSKDYATLHTITGVGVADDACQIAGDGGELEIGFNCKYLQEALRAIPTSEVILELSDSLSPIVLSPPEDKFNFTYMVLPVRLREERK